MLIGAIVLEALDLLVDSRTQTLQPRDPKGIITEIEWGFNPTADATTEDGMPARNDGRTEETQTVTNV